MQAVAGNGLNGLAAGPWRLSVAPMMDWTDRHCRFFHRLLTRRTRLYTEMVTTGALIHGDVPRHLGYDPVEHPVALQLGGSEPADLAHCARLAQAWGYEEVNLNCGCPSERVQRGAFGACLMAEPALVRDCLGAMREAVRVPVTVKCRIGIDDQDEEEDFLPPERRKPKPRSGSDKKGEEGKEEKMTEQEARGSLEGLKNEFNRKMPAGQQDGQGGSGGKPKDKKGKDY